MAWADLKKILSIVLGVILLLPRIAEAAPIYPVEKVINQFLDMDFFLDASKQISFSSVSSQKFEHIKGIPNMGYLQGTAWLRVFLENTSMQKKEMYLEIDNPLLNKITIYVKHADGDVVESTLGDTLPFEQRLFFFRTFITKVSFNAQEKLEFYFKINTETSFKFPIKLWNEKDLFERIGRDSIHFGGYFGLLLLMFFYNVLLFMRTKKVIFISYLLYLFFSILFQFSNLGLLFQFMFQSEPKLMNAVHIGSLGFAIYFFILFSRNYLNTRVNFTKIDYFLKFLMIMAIIGGSVVNLSFGLSLHILLGIVCILPIQIILAILLYRKRYLPALYYILAWGFLIIGGLTYSLTLFGIFPLTAITANAYLIGSLIENVFLSLGISYRIESIRKKVAIAVHEKKTALVIAKNKNLLLEKAKLQHDSDLRTAHLEELGRLGIHLGDRINTPLCVIELALEEVLDLLLEKENTANSKDVLELLEKIHKQSGLISKEIEDLRVFRKFASQSDDFSPSEGSFL